mgnify:CR=1 FL=1
MRISEAHQDSWFRSHALGAYATGVSLAGDLDRSTLLLRESMRFGVEVEDRIQVAWAVEELGLIAAGHGDPERGAILEGVYAGMAAEMGLQAQVSPWHDS